MMAWVGADDTERGGNLPLARALVAERVRVKPGSAFDQALEQRIAA
jgi:hypothetical protein